MKKHVKPKLFTIIKEQPKPQPYNFDVVIEEKGEIVRVNLKSEGGGEA